MRVTGCFFEYFSRCSWTVAPVVVPVGVTEGLEVLHILSEYRRREINEAMLQFKANPESGWELLASLMDGYMDGVKAGKIKP